MKTFHPIARIAALCLSLVGPASAGELAGSEWRPVKIGEETLADVKPFVRFGEDGRISGNGGCNGFGGDYTLAGGTIEISQLTMTMMACAGETVMDHERLFLRALEEAAHFERDGTRLVLSDDGGEPLAEFIERH